MHIEPDNNSLWVARKTTIPQGKNKWLCANIIYKVITNDNITVKLQTFNFDSITVSISEFQEEFYQLDYDEEYVYSPYYPTCKVSLSEFDIKRISINKLEKHFEKNPSILNAIKKAKQDAYNSKGNQFCITIEKYNDYKINPKSNKLERIGDPIFNRSTRHSPPISKSYTYDKFTKSASFPAPIGIREEDFALPSEQNEILIDLLSQIFSCKNAPVCPEEIKNELGLHFQKDTHICLWCGEIMDLSNINQNYCAEEHSINFCHRIPELGTKKGNVYIGHCSCNREQGGYSEEQRVEQIIRLAKTNPKYKQLILDQLS